MKTTRSLLLALVGAVAPVACGVPMAARPTESKPAACVDATPHTLRFVTVAPGVELQVIDWGGEGETMVLLTGSGDNAHVYDQFAFLEMLERHGFCYNAKPGKSYFEGISVLPPYRVD